METIIRNYLEIKSLNQLSEIKKPSGNYSLKQVLPNDFQLNKFGLETYSIQFLSVHINLSIH